MATGGLSCTRDVDSCLVVVVAATATAAAVVITVVVAVAVTRGVVLVVVVVVLVVVVVVAVVVVVVVVIVMVALSFHLLKAPWKKHREKSHKQMDVSPPKPRRSWSHLGRGSVAAWTPSSVDRRPAQLHPAAWRLQPAAPHGGFARGRAPGT